MANNLGASPDQFSLSPLLALLPEQGELHRLHTLISAFCARQEQVEASRGEAVDREAERRSALEAAMLRQVVEWLADKPGEGE